MITARVHNSVLLSVEQTEYLKQMAARFLTTRTGALRIILDQAMMNDNVTPRIIPPKQKGQNRSLSASIPDDLFAFITEEASRERVPVSALVRQLIAQRQATRRREVEATKFVGGV